MKKLSHINEGWGSLVRRDLTDEVRDEETTLESRALKNPEWVDLGFDFLVANCNFGADNPWEEGTVIQSNQLEKYIVKDGEKKPNPNYIGGLPYKSNTRYANSGDVLRMSDYNFDQLVRGCKVHTHEKMKGVDGVYYEGDNGNVVFFPYNREELCAMWEMFWSVRSKTSNWSCMTFGYSESGWSPGAGWTCHQEGGCPTRFLKKK